MRVLRFVILLFLFSNKLFAQNTAKPWAYWWWPGCRSGEGLVLDHFDKENVEHYLSKFDSLFSKNHIGIRAFYNDSYEVYGADWTEHFLPNLKKKRL
ncbi:MAG: hypothetical protein IPH28_19720 [Cytophagaceae bacterium]|nr:hypothetical protein [Cytophagaceae bacterium]